MKTNRRQSHLKEDDADPLSVVVNLFDVAMVFAVALMVSMVKVGIGISPCLVSLSTGTRR